MSYYRHFRSHHNSWVSTLQRSIFVSTEISQDWKRLRTWTELEFYSKAGKSLLRSHLLTSALIKGSSHQSSKKGVPKPKHFLNRGKSFGQPGMSQSYRQERYQDTTCKQQKWEAWWYIPLVLPKVHQILKKFVYNKNIFISQFGSFLG